MLRINRPKSGRRPRALNLVGLSAALAVSALPASAQNVSKTYTDDADFDLGTLVNVNHDSPNNDQLQLDVDSTPAPFLYVPASGRGTVLRIDVETGEVLGEYRSAPMGMGQDPSRTTVDGLGNCWAGNRARDISGVQGSVVKIGTVIGGTRVNANGTPNPNGEYLAPPYDYNTCVDRDGDGLIRTSNGAGNVLDWPDNGDGMGGSGGGPALVMDALDECILVYQITGCPNIRQVSVDAAGDVWAGGYPFQPTCFQLLSGADGTILQTVNTFSDCGGFSGTIDPSGVLWSASNVESQLMRYDPVADLLQCFGSQPFPGGVAIALDESVLVAGSAQVRRYDSNGAVLNTYNVAGADGLVGIAMTPADGDIWAASFDTNQVYRLDAAGNVKTSISVDEQPNGLSVDFNGKVWVVCLESDTVQRINPATDSVDLTVSLGNGAQPFSPSDMTGVADVGMTVPTGTWDVVYDGMNEKLHWRTVQYTSSQVNGSSLTPFVRAASTLAQLAATPYTQVANGVEFDLPGRFVQVRVDFEKAPMGNESPILFDLTINGSEEIVPMGCDTENRRLPGSLLLFPEFDNTMGTVSILTVSNDNLGGDDVLVEYVYIDEDDCEETNRTELFTANDTLTLLTDIQNPDMERGYVYAFVKATRGGPIVHNHLTGNLLIVDGIDAFEYSINPVSFLGIGPEGSSTDSNGDDVRDLDGVEYTQAPDQIFVPRFLGQTEANPEAGALIESELIVLGLTGGQEFDTTIDFLIYNDNEEVFSSELTFNCWDRIPLLEISGVFGFEFLSLWTNDDPEEVAGAPWLETGWFKIDGAFATSTTNSIPDPAFYAVLVERINGYGVADLPFEYCTQDNGALVERGLGLAR